MFFRFLKNLFRPRPKCASQQYWQSPADRFTPAPTRRNLYTRTSSFFSGTPNSLDKSALPITMKDLALGPKPVQRERTSSTTSSFFSAEASPRRMRTATQRSAPNLGEVAEHGYNYYSERPLPPPPAASFSGITQRGHFDVCPSDFNPSPYTRMYSPAPVPNTAPKMQRAAAFPRAPVRAKSQTQAPESWRPFHKCLNCGYMNPVTQEARVNIPCQKCPATYSVSRRTAEKARELHGQLGGHRRRRSEQERIRVGQNGVVFPSVYQ